MPILGTFVPTHIGSSEALLPFGEVFDVPRLGRELRKPVLEWRDVKDPNSEVVEPLGCWSPWSVSGDADGLPRGNGNSNHLKIGASLLLSPFPPGVIDKKIYFYI